MDVRLKNFYERTCQRSNMTQRDDGHDYRDSKNKQEQYEKQKKEKREQAQRLIDKWNSWQIQSWLAIKGFDQYHGIKLVNQALSKQKLDKGGY